MTAEQAAAEAIQKALEAKPTSGPWIAPGGYGVHTVMPDGRTGPALLAATTKSGAMDNHDANTAYVAACNPSNIAPLLAERTKLREALQLYIAMIYSVENRCMAADGPVTKTCDEITDDELRKVYVAIESALKGGGV